MRVQTLIVDNFYDNVDDVRAFALAQDFDVKGNYPGLRTKPFLNESTKETINDIMKSVGGSVTSWHEDCGFTGAFQLCTAQERTWIHADPFNTWAAVCYLTPNAPITAGTALYRHKASGEMFKTDTDYESYDYTKWDRVDQLGNIYNRLVIYRGDIFHASVDYFGSNFADGRLFQTFFFDTEY